MNSFYRGSVHAAVFLVLSCSVLMGSGCSRGGSGKIPPSEWLPAILAEEAVALAGEKDDVKVVLIRMHSIGGLPDDQAKADAMRATMSLYDGLTVIADETIGRNLDPTQSMLASMQGGLPAEEFFRAAKKHTHADVIISLDGAPSLRGRNAKTMASGLPPTICMLMSDEGAQALLAGGVADMVIVPLGQSLVHQNAQTARELFENSYRILK